MGTSWKNKVKQLNKEGRVKDESSGEGGRIAIFRQMMVQYGMPVPASEHYFHPDRYWRFDLAFPDVKLAVEIEGGIYGSGQRCDKCGQAKRTGHTSIKGILRDMEKYNEATRLGWRVLRFTPKALLTDETANIIRQTYDLCNRDHNQGRTD